jgi:hypothetical protein
MTKKQLFGILSILFVLLMCYFAYDLAKNTTKPWGKKQMHRIEE